MTTDETHPDPHPDPSAASAGAVSAGAVAQTPDAPTSDARKGGLLLAVFWAWAGLLALVTVAQLFEIESILNVLDVKRWFAR